MQHSGFTEHDIRKAEAIVGIFETGKPHGSFYSLAILDDGAGISYGIKQFTHRSGSLFAVAERYLRNGGVVGREVIAERSPVLRRKSAAAIAKLSADVQFKKALRAAAVTREMREAQTHIAFEKYMLPAIAECRRLGFSLPLSLAVVYDSVVHGSFEAVRDDVPPAETEKKWIAAYVERRNTWLRSCPRLKKTAYRTRFFLKQIEDENWQLRLPADVNGYHLTNEVIYKIEAEMPRQSSPGSAETIPESLPDPLQTSRDQTVAAPANQEAGESDREGRSILDEVEKRVNEAAAEVDRVEQIVATASTRSDKIKSLWTTIAGTLWQMFWAVGGFLAGVPREIWLTAAIIAGLLMLAYLYRQIALGKLRERVN